MSQRTGTRADAVPRAAAALVAAIGIVVFTGWVVDVSALRGPIPGLIEMKANTAVGLVLLGCSLWLTRHRHPRWRFVGQLTAAVAGAIGLATVVQYLLGVNLGFDELLFHDKLGAAKTVHPGRLAPQTAVSFVLAWLAFGLLHRRTRRHLWAVHAAATFMMLLSLFALIGYAYGANTLGTVPALSPMAVHTALACFVLGAGILWVSPPATLATIVAGNAAGSLMARRLLPVAVIVLPGFGWIRLAGEDAGLYDADTGVALMVIAFLAVFVVGILATARMLHRAERERRAATLAQRRLAAVVESSGDAIFSATTDGVVNSWNPGAERLFGYAAEEIVGSSGRLLTPPGHRDEEASIPRRVLDGERIDQYETERVAKDGSQLAVSLTLAPIHDADGAVIGVSAIARDIGEQRRTREALARAKDEADHANMAKSRFLSRMSHELRTPLNAILGFGQLLELEELDSTQSENVEQILKGGRHLLELINEVLEISRIEAGEMPMSIEPVDVPLALTEVVQLMSPLAAERQIAMQIVAGDTGSLFALADNQRLRQVLLNLVSNAIKYNRAGGDVAVSVEPVADAVRIAVSDSGAGIPAAQLPKLFNPFERLDAESEDVEGTGLGLALSKRLVEAMDGTISVESQEGTGTTFVVDLLGAQGPLERHGPEISIDRIPREVPADARRTVLCIEDNVSNVKLLERIFARRPEIELLASGQGTLGVELARQHRPDLILLDLNLPDIPGEAVLEQLREYPETAEIPIVVLSADATERQVERLLARGVRDYLTKPFDVKRLLALVDELLGGATVSSR